ncbi:MAG: TrkH family potassium uptake protein [Clostridia bacterium]|nr:TrkH family potassium uptake protein [Clostridia bacterium]
MNKKLILRMLGSILLVEAVCMLPSLILAIAHGEHSWFALLVSMLACAACALPMRFLVKPQSANLRAREGFLVVTLAWLLMSFFGALPFMISGFIPNFFDAFFEAVSGFTTTGATTLTAGQFNSETVHGMDYGIGFWRAFTHWIGGMGVLVLTLALLPRFTGRSAHLVRAESPGPSLSKIAPKMTDSAKILYIIYGVLTLLEFVALMLCGLEPYDAALHAVSNAGTGGFSNRANSIAYYNNPAAEIVITVFMVLFSTNLALYFALVTGRWRDVVRNEELKWFLFMYFGSALVIAGIVLAPVYSGNAGDALRHACFNVATVMSTTGFTIDSFTDPNYWPIAAHGIILCLMFCGACVGSTAGGIKTMRVALMLKQSKREIGRTFNPRRVQRVRFEGRGIDEGMLHQVAVFCFVYVGLVLVGAMLISFDGKFDLISNFTASLTCVSNIGPCFGAGASGFSEFGSFSKVVMSILMLAGRLELFPILAFFHRDAWRRA